MRSIAACDAATAPLGSVDISYAEQANKFRTVANFDMTTFSKAGAEPTEVSFVLP